MRAVTCALALGVLGNFVLPTPDVVAQQVTVATPYHSVGDSFFENIGTSWGLRGPNWGLSVFGSPVQAAPQFGGFDPSAGANFGFGFGGGGVGGNFNANMTQGSRRSFTSVTPSVTLQNGFPGSISDTSQSPFVISYIPVVGGFPTFGTLRSIAPRPTYGGQGSAGANPAVTQALRQARMENQRPAGGGEIQTAPAAQVPLLGPPDRPAHRAEADDNALVLAREGAATEAPQDEAARKLSAARSSSAARPAMSVAEARRLHEREQTGQTDEVLGYLQRARGAEAAGKLKVAKIYYQMAHHRASGDLRGQIQARLSALGSGP